MSPSIDALGGEVKIAVTAEIIMAEIGVTRDEADELLAGLIATGRVQIDGAGHPYVLAVVSFSNGGT